MKKQLPFIAISIAILAFLINIMWVFIMSDRMEVLEEKDACHEKISVDKLTTCDYCGCLIWDNHENHGKGEIRTRRKSYNGGYLTAYPDMEDYIYYPKYCKEHKPNVK